MGFRQLGKLTWSLGKVDILRRQKIILKPFIFAMKVQHFVMQIPLHQTVPSNSKQFQAVPSRFQALEDALRTLKDGP